MVSLITLFSINIYSKKKLDDEVKIILKKDVSKSNFDTETKSLFRYSKIEKAIKEYMKDYFDKIKKANDIINDETIKKVLSSSNYESDGPQFDKSLKYLETKLKKFNDTITKLSKMSDKKEILKYIDKYELSNKYVEIYKNYMFGKDYSKDIENNKNIINKINDTGLKILNTDISVLKLLKDNNEGWIVKEGSIHFYSKDLMEKYNELVEILNK